MEGEIEEARQKVMRITNNLQKLMYNVHVHLQVSTST